MVVFFEVCWFTDRLTGLVLYTSHISGTKKMKNLWYNRVQGHCLYLNSFMKFKVNIDF